jgi:hypothetical protein
VPALGLTFHHGLLINAADTLPSSHFSMGAGVSFENPFSREKKKEPVYKYSMGGTLIVADAAAVARDEADLRRINEGASVRDIARERAELRAKEEAERRYSNASFTDMGPESPLLSSRSSFGFGLSPKEKSLARIGLGEPKLAYATTSSIVLGWSPIEEGAGSTIKSYEVQWKRYVNSETRPGGVVEAWSATADQPHLKVYFRCGDDWSSIPDTLPNVLRIQMHISGLPEDCCPLRFRVRARCHAGWGNWSPTSGAIRVLPSKMPAPTVSVANAYNAEIKWTPLTDKRYGVLKHYIVFAKLDLTSTKDGESDYIECVTCQQSKLNVDRIGDVGLTPATPYSFKIVAVCIHGDSESDRDISMVTSDTLKMRTTVAPPDPPAMPTIMEVKARQCRLSWNTPCCNGTKVTSFKLLMKTGSARVYREAYSGPLTVYTVERLQPNTEYNFKVAAANQRGTSEASPPVMLVTDDGPKVLVPERTSPPSGSIASPSGLETDAELADALEKSIEDAGSPSQYSTPVRVHNRRQSIRDSNQDIDLAGSVPQRRSPTLPDRERVGAVKDGWVECWDAKVKQTYYFHPATGITQWEHPRGTKLDPDLVFRRKRFKFLYTLHKRDFKDGAREVLPLKVNRNEIVYSSFQQFRGLASPHFKMVTKVIFESEDGIDSGGLTKNWFLELSRAFLNPALLLFRKCGENSEQYEIEPRSGINEEHLAYFRFIGQILGKAAYDRQLVDVNFSSEIYKHILGMTMTLNDLEAKDKVYYRSLKWMLENDVTDVVYETFSVTVDNFGMSETISLKPGGELIEVVEGNKLEYVTTIAKWKLHGAVEDQIHQLCLGFYDVIPLKAIQTFNALELELLLNGKPEIDIDEVKNSTRYTGGYDVRSPEVKTFWAVFEQMTMKDRAKLLKFITGTSKVPLDGFDPLFTITKGSDGSDALPRSHTCFNQIVVPPYETFELCRSKLTFAIENAVGFHLT